MIVYELPKRFGKWNAQLEWLKQFWKDGKETMSVSGDVVLIRNGKRLTNRTLDGGYALAKFMQSSSEFTSHR